MKKLLLIICCLYGLLCNAQKIRFEYDAAGNQVLRTLCLICPSRENTQIPKDLSEIEEADLIKFFPEDIISYYPNPVKEELFLKWDLIENNSVSNIDVYSLNGQLLKSFKGNLTQNSQIINFIDLPVGVYYVNLIFLNGETKSIKIIKN
jgi:hypothetical protein